MALKALSGHKEIPNAKQSGGIYRYIPFIDA
jgi:hypothetical protein